mmetsp:Transcript_25892/g.83285  ORF Transcript_25892/g.83285 Transcript_25892/m.83285 type:complete len:262 (-) Transcript_25892:143-928(-)
MAATRNIRLPLRADRRWSSAAHNPAGAKAAAAVHHDLRRMVRSGAWNATRGSARRRQRRTTHDLRGAVAVAAAATQASWHPSPAGSTRLHPELRTRPLPGGSASPTWERSPGARTRAGRAPLLHGTTTALGMQPARTATSGPGSGLAQSAVAMAAAPRGSAQRPRHGRVQTHRDLPPRSARLPCPPGLGARTTAPRWPPRAFLRATRFRQISWAPIAPHGRAAAPLSGWPHRQRSGPTPPTMSSHPCSHSAAGVTAEQRMA